MLKRRKFLTLSLILSVVLLVSISTVGAESLTHIFTINENLSGFSARNADINYEVNIIRDGSTGGIRVNIFEGMGYANLAVRDSSVENSHPDWMTDWTAFDKITAWIYFDELETMPENKGVAIRVGGNKGTQAMTMKSELKVGWNYIEADLLALVDGQVTNLADMDSSMIEFVVDKNGMYIVDEIQLVKVSN